MHSQIPHAAHDLPPVPAERIAQPFKRFMALSSAGGLVLLFCTIVAMLWANSGWADVYHHIFHDLEIEISIGSLHLSHGLAHWINDALMAIFFLVVGLEIKRELVVGELSSPRKAALPIVAALGGMVAPALIFAALNWGQPSIRGWGVPMATDIAFALGIICLLGKRAPVGLKVFLTSLAIVDDLGALIVIAVFYTEQLNTTALFDATLVVCVMAFLNILKVRKIIPYLIAGVFLWYFVLESGVHATIAGVLTACCIPASARVDSIRFLESSKNALSIFESAAKPGHCVRTSDTQRSAVITLERNAEHVLPPLHRLELLLHPWAAFLIIPIFAVANAGLHVGHDAAGTLTSNLTLGVILGLFLGKPLGIFIACWISCRLGIAALPSGANWKQLLGVGFLGGIGFTMALFIANLAFPTAHDLEAAKMGIMLASFLSAVTGSVLLIMAAPSTADATGAEPSAA